MEYGYTKELNMSFEEALDDVTLSLGEQGFGILTKINVQSAMKNKINEEMDQYVILGACNPSLAFEALGHDYEIGLVLPCNVIVYEKNEKIYVSAVKASVAIGFIGSEQIKSIAQKADEKLQKAIDAL